MNNKPSFFNKDMAKRLAKKTAIGGAIGFASGGAAKYALKKPIDKLVGKYQQKALDANDKYWGERMSSNDNLFQKLYGGETELSNEEIDKAVDDHHKHWDEKEKKEVDPHFKKLYRAASLREAPTGKIGAGIGFTKGLYDEVKRYRKEKKDYEEMNKQASFVIAIPLKNPMPPNHSEGRFGRVLKKTLKGAAVGAVIGAGSGKLGHNYVKNDLKRKIVNHENSPIPNTREEYEDDYSPDDHFEAFFHRGKPSYGKELHKSKDERLRANERRHKKKNSQYIGGGAVGGGAVGALAGFARGLKGEWDDYNKSKNEMNKQASDIKWADFETFKPQSLKLETFKPESLKLETFKPQTGEWTKNNNSTKSSSPEDEVLSKNQKIGLGIAGTAATLYGAHRLRKYLKKRKEQKERGENK